VHALKNERLLIKITKVYKRFAHAKIVKILEKSPKRQCIKCSQYGKCGGCSFLHEDYESETNKKKNHIEKLFNIKVDKSYFGNEYNYRNKATFHVKNGKIGYYKEESHELVEFDECLLLDNRINLIYKYLKEMDLSSLNTVMIRTTKNEVMIKFDSEFDYAKLVENIKIDSIYINDKLVYGKEYIIQTIDDIKYSIYPDAFFQVNTLAMKELYDVVKEYASRGNKLLDLYSGTGTIGIYLKNNFENIVGIEINESSIKNANINKKLNNLENIKFVCGDAKIAKKDKYDLIIVDPPRSGLTKDVIKYLNESKSKIIYVSCNPDTLKRDINLLDNYIIEKISVINMFPKTKHIETIVKLNEK